MPTEIHLLYIFLGMAFILAPLMTNEFFLDHSKFYADSHKFSLIVLLMGSVFHFGYVALIWPLFCAGGLIIYLRKEAKAVFSLEGAARCIPFVFSMISSFWYVAGVNDWHLLGYNKSWSFYAALHGAFLGWIFVGCLAFLSKRSFSNKIYTFGCYLSLFFFLLVAFGIDGAPEIKPFGVVGFSALVPITIGFYIFNLNRAQKTSIIFAAMSLIAICISMTFAIRNEFWASASRFAFGLPIMVLAHGFLNAVVATPCFFIAIRFDGFGSIHRSKPIENVIFFDDLCVLCSGTVKLLMSIDRNRNLRYSSLQGSLAQTVLNKPQVSSGGSVIYWSEGVVYDRAEAVGQILIRLGGIYKLTGIGLLLMPLFIINQIYDWIADNRYRLFGKNDVCFVPTNEDKHLFIS